MDYDGIYLFISHHYYSPLAPHTSIYIIHTRQYNKWSGVQSPREKRSENTYNTYQVPVSFTPIHGATADSCWENPPNGVFRRGCTLGIPGYCTCPSMTYTNRLGIRVYTPEVTPVYTIPARVRPKQLGWVPGYLSGYSGIYRTYPRTTKTTGCGTRVP